MPHRFEPMLAQADEVVRAVDHAAQQSGQWFLVAAVVAMGIAIAWMARAFQLRHDKLAARLDEVQDQHTKFLEEALGRLTGSLDRNSAAMLEFSHSLSSVHRLLEGRPTHAPNLP